MKKLMLFTITAFSSLSLLAQTNDNYSAGGHVNTGAAFLSISSDVRGAGMAETGVSLTGDAFSIYNNPARIAFLQDEISSIAFSYKPIASGLAKGIKNVSLSGYTWLNQGEYLALNLQYFSLGDVHFYDEQANEQQFLIPNEFAIGASYVKQLGENIGLGLTFKGIFSSITGGVEVNGAPTSNAFALAADVGILGKVPISDENYIGYGLSLLNVGSKISYFEGQKKSFLPSELKFGGSYNATIMDDSKLSFSLDFSKPLVPSKPLLDEDGNILKGKNPDRGVVDGLFSSFADSPDGMMGELKEFGIGLGTEVNFKDTFIVRGGVNMRPNYAGRNSIAAIGLGYKADLEGRVLKIETAYQVPLQQNGYLRNSFHIGISFTFLE